MAGFEVFTEEPPAFVHNLRFTFSVARLELNGKSARIPENMIGWRRRNDEWLQ